MTVDTNVLQGQSGLSDSTSGPVISSTTSKDDSKKNNTLDVNDFLKLLVTQMQYQDPLEPMDNTQYIAQMATFTQVQATTDMKGKVEEQTASSLVGKIVEMKTELNSDGYITGKVDFWSKIDGKVYLSIENKLYDISDLNTVIDNDYYKEYLDKINQQNPDKSETPDVPDKNEDEKDKDTQETQKA